MNPQAIIKAGTTVIGKVAGTPLGRKVVMNAPKILFGLGVVSTVGAVGASVVGGIKAADILEETREKVDEIHSEPEESRDEKEESKALLRVYLSTGADLVKIFWPTVLLTGLSIGCFSKGYGILNERNAALIASYNGLDKMFKAYRSRVIDKEGRDQDTEYYFGVKKEDGCKTEDIVDPKTGEVIGQNQIGYTEALPWEELYDDPYTIIIDERSRIWSRNPDVTLFNLKNIQEWANAKLSEQGSLFINELREHLDVPRTKAGAALGWVVKEDEQKRRTSNYVDFGIFYVNPNDEHDEHMYDGYRTEVDRILDGGAEPIVLHINPDGIVYDLMK